MRLTRRVIINTVAFLVLGMFLVVLLAIQVLPTVFRSSYSIYGIFTDGGGVASNQEVTYRGVQVGRVGKMSLTRDAVKIELVIDAKYKIPKEGTHARVLFKSAVGEQFVDLLPAVDTAPFFRSRDEIPLSMTSIPVQTEDLLRELDAVLRSIDPKALGTLIHELGVGLTGHGTDLNLGIKALDALAKIGADRRTDVSSIIGNAADVQDTFNATSAEFVSAVSSLRTVLRTLVARKAELERTLGSTKNLGTNIIALLDSRRSQLNTIIADVGTTVRTTHSHLGDVNKLLTYLGGFLGDAVKAYDAPYYVFNLLSNTDAGQCNYSPSSRPVRAVTDDSPKQPINNFRCPSDTFTSASASAGSIAGLSPALRIEMERISWLQLFTLGY